MNLRFEKHKSYILIMDAFDLFSIFTMNELTT